MPSSLPLPCNGTENDLVYREVNAILQDRQEFRWFVAKFGLNRFDGLTFTTFTKDTNGFDFDDVRSIAQDADGLLWLMGPLGRSAISLFNPVSGMAISFEKRFSKYRPSAFTTSSPSLLAGPDATIFFIDYQPAKLTTYHPESGLREVLLPRYKSLELVAVTGHSERTSGK